MLPNNLQVEIGRRLNSDGLPRAKLKSICRAMGIDIEINEAPQPTPEQVAQGLRALLPSAEVSYGVLPFEFETVVDAEARRLPGRLIVAHTPWNADAGRGHMVTECQALIWHEGEAGPEWSTFDEAMLPLRLVAQLDDMLQDGAENGLWNKLPD